jgi:hypothetical protein
LTLAQVEQAPAELKVQVDDRHFEFGGDLLEAVRLSGTGGTSDDDQLVVCALGGTDEVQNLRKKNISHTGPHSGAIQR